jgi:hypothetical protein
VFANHDSDRTEQVGMKSLDGSKDGLVLQQRAPHNLRCWLSLPFEGAGFHPQSLACEPGTPCAACWRGSPGFSGSYAVEACRGLACSPDPSPPRLSSRCGAAGAAAASSL